MPLSASLAAGAIVSIGTVLVLGTCELAIAQLPVCAPPSIEEPMYSACVDGGRFAVVPFLSSLAVDQLIRTDRPTFTRDPEKLARDAISPDTLEANASVRDFLSRLPELELVRIDSSTGTFRMDIEDGERTFKGEVTAGEVTSNLELELPARLEGGYWRTAGSLQMAFWKGQRLSFKTESEGARIAGEAECLVVSVDGIRLVTSGPESPDLLLRFGPCE